MILPEQIKQQLDGAAAGKMGTQTNPPADPA